MGALGTNRLKCFTSKEAFSFYFFFTALIYDKSLANFELFIKAESNFS